MPCCSPQQISPAAILWFHIPAVHKAKASLQEAPRSQICKAFKVRTAALDAGLHTIMDTM